MSQPEFPPPYDPARDPALTDLPPVEAPSAGFIVQLFVIPAVIVAVVIVVWLLFGKLAGGERDAMEYVRLLRSPNAHWRAAYELASLIQNDPKLAADPKLLGELTDLLSDDLDLDQSPELTQYVTLTLGAFQTLEARPAGGIEVDPLAVLARALEPKQPLQVRLAAAISLAKQAARLEGRLDHAAAIKSLARASEDDDAGLRQAAVYALGFFAEAESTPILEARLKDTDCYVRYNAAIALGRRGNLESRGVFREMLSPTDLHKIVKLPSPTETQSKIEAIELEALQALEHAADQKQPALAESLRPEIQGLSKSGLVSIRNRAESVLKTLPATP